MIILSTVLALLWVVSLKYAEKRRKDLKFRIDVISDYISDSRALQLGFVSLTASLCIFGYLVSDISTFASNCFYLGGIGSFLVAATRSDKVYNTKGTKYDWWHILGAGLAFAVTTLGCLVISYGRSEFLFGLAFSIPLYSILGFIYRMDDGDKERIVAYPLILWFAINTLAPVIGQSTWTIF